MRMTIDIPDDVHQALKLRALAEGRSMKQLLLRAAESALSEPPETKTPRLARPLLNKGKPGSLHITNEIIYDLLDFP